MNKTLILTGWSKKVYMTAAATALEAREALGISVNTLKKYLADPRQDLTGFVKI